MLFVGSMSIQESFKRLSNYEICSNPLDHLHFSRFARIKEKISRENTLRAPLMKRGPKVFLKYLTPSSPRCDSRPRTPLYIDASPTSLLFSAGPRFLASSCVRSNQSSTSFSHLNHEVDPSKSGGIFYSSSTGCCPVVCGFCTARATQ